MWYELDLCKLYDPSRHVRLCKQPQILQLIQLLSQEQPPRAQFSSQGVQATQSIEARQPQNFVQQKLRQPDLPGQSPAVLEESLPATTSEAIQLNITAESGSPPEWKEIQNSDTTNLLLSSCS